MLLTRWVNEFYCIAYSDKDAFTLKRVDYKNPNQVDTFAEVFEIVTAMPSRKTHSLATFVTAGLLAAGAPAPKGE